MTENQEAVYGFIVKYKQQHDGNSPTIREIMETTEYNSTSAVMAALQTLRAKGLIKLPREKRTRQVEVVGGVWLPPEMFQQVSKFIDQFWPEGS